MSEKIILWMVMRNFLGDAAKPFKSMGATYGMGVPAARIMRFIAYMLYIVGARANPGGHTDTRIVCELIVNPMPSDKEKRMLHDRTRPLTGGHLREKQK